MRESRVVPEAVARMVLDVDDDTAYDRHGVNVCVEARRYRRRVWNRVGGCRRLSSRLVDGHRCRVGTLRGGSPVFAFFTIELGRETWDGRAEIKDCP